MPQSRPLPALPAEGYGQEPKNEVDIILLAAARIQSLLPSDWAVEIETVSGGLGPVDIDDDAQLSLTRGGEVMVPYVLGVKRVVASNSLIPTINKLIERAGKQGSMRPMLVARYFSPQHQQALRERGVAYADATGNLGLASDDPLMVLSDRGASADPWRGPGRPGVNLKGLPAAKLVRALADFTPPYSVADLAKLAGASLGAAYRLTDLLVGEGLVTREERGPITEVDWPVLLERWSQEAGYLDTSTTYGFLEPRGLDRVVDKLAGRVPEQEYAVSGSIAAQPFAPYAEPRLAIIYTGDPMSFASTYGLRRVEAGANVILVSPRSPVVFERATTWRGITTVAPSQAVADLLGGPGRNPAEGHYLLDWMKENPDGWRSQPNC